MSKKEIEEHGLKYSKKNIMDKPYKYFSGRDLKCFNCGMKIVRAAYSKNMLSGYFKTLKGKTHNPECDWEKSKKYVPANPVLETLRKMLENMKKSKKPYAPGKFSTRHSNVRNFMDMKWIEKGKKIDLGVRSGFKYKGRINNISSSAGTTYISLFHDGVNKNVRISMPTNESLPKSSGNYYVLISNAEPGNSSSRINLGVDIRTKDDMYIFEEIKRKL